MKIFFQVLLFLIIVFFFFLIYKTYFQKIDNISSERINYEKKDLSSQNNNFIKNLKYEILLQDNTKYSITALESEIIYINNVELVRMNNVIGIITNKDNITMSVKSDNAIYNDKTYVTNFSDNILIEYQENKILSDKMLIDFQNNIVHIAKNVIYDGEYGKINTDNIFLDFINSKISFFMDNDKKKILVKNR
jgi:hypothetical protein